MPADAKKPSLLAGFITLAVLAISIGLIGLTIWSLIDL